jgi:lysophospholipase L1-like esterase
MIARALRRLASALAGPLLAIIVFCVVGEFLARQFDIVDRLNGYNRILFAPGPTPRIPYALRPSVHTTQFGIPVEVNALGMRGPEVSVRPESGVRRVLLLGDSVVFGQGISGATLPEVLARELNAAGERRWEVLNAGVPGYNLVAEAAALEDSWLALSPDVVVVVVSFNDFGPTPRFSPLSLLTLEEPSVVERSELLVLLRWLTGWSRGTLPILAIEQAEHDAHDRAAFAPAPPAAGLVDLTRQLHLGFYRAPKPDGIARLRDGLSALRRICAGARIPLVAAIFPESYQVGVPTPDLTPQRVLLDLCREVGVRCIDLFPPFAAANGGSLFLDASHPNEAGIQVVARAMADVLLAAPPER